MTTTIRKSPSFKKICLFFICLTIFIVFLRLGFVSYETNDDELMNLMAVGAFGYPTQYLIYNNILYGYLLKGLYTLFGQINWYFWIPLVLNFLSIYASSIYLTKKQSLLTSIGITLFIHILLTHDFYVVFQYTKSATLYAVVGELILYHYLFSNQKKDFYLATFFITSSLLLRSSCFLFSLPFLCIFLFVQFLKQENRFSYMKKVILAFLPTLILFGTFTFAHHHFYSKDGWDTFTEYNQYRTNLIDYYGHLDYEAYADEFAKANITKNAYELMQIWDYGDRDVFTLEWMKNASDIETSHLKNLNRFPSMIWLFIRHMGNLLYSHNYYAWLLVLLYIFLIVKKKKDYGLLMIGVAILFFLEYMYLYFLSRVMWRAEIGIWLTPLVLFAYHLFPSIPNASRNKKTFIVLAIALLFGLSSVYLLLEANRTKSYYQENNHEAFFKEIQNRYPDAYYVGDVLTFFHRQLIKEPYNVNTSYKDAFINFQEMGGWQIPSPTGAYFFDQAGITNPVKALIEKDNVYLCCNDEDTLQLIEDYLNEVYQSNIHLVFKENIEGIDIYQAQ